MNTKFIYYLDCCFVITETARLIKSQYNNLLESNKLSLSKQIKYLLKIEKLQIEYRKKYHKAKEEAFKIIIEKPELTNDIIESLKEFKACLFE